MKILLVILSVVIVLFLGSQIYLYQGSHKIEGYKYEVITAYPGFEIRKYEASLFTSIELDTDDYKQASSKGFSALGGYIFGKNEDKEQISMTSPVAMSLEAETTMMFLVPKKYTIDNLPKPQNPNIEFIEMPERMIAAVTFSGWASNEKIARYRLALEEMLEKTGIKHTGRFSVLGYNPPYEFLFRRNEIIVELETISE